MTLAGQWIAPYQGTTDGRLVLDLDEVGCHYEGTAIAWARMPQNLNSLVRFQTPSNTHAERIQKVPVVLIDNNGDPVTPGMLQHQKEQGIVYPATVDIDLALKGQNLTVSWVSSIGATGQAVATLPNTRCGAKSDLKVQRLNTWDGFKKAVNKLEKKRYVFRGQEDHNWRLRSSFHRTGRSNIERYLIQDISDLQKLFSSLSPHVFNLNDPFHYGAFLNLTQHHGYPTPLLDWTWSPYVAAFFAYHRISKQVDPRNKKKVRIFKFDLQSWSKLNRATRLFPIWPNVSVLDALAFGNPRVIPQQSISTTSNVDDVESYIQMMEKENAATYLEAFDLPISERNYIMHELSLMGITAGALFPGFDGACEGLKERNF